MAPSASGPLVVFERAPLRSGVDRSAAPVGGKLPRHCFERTPIRGGVKRLAARGFRLCFWPVHTVKAPNCWPRDSSARGARFKPFAELALSPGGVSRPAASLSGAQSSRARLCGGVTRPAAQCVRSRRNRIASRTKTRRDGSQCESNVRRCMVARWQW